MRKVRDPSCLLLLTDGMFAHDGSAAPLHEYRSILPRTALMLVDDAHGAGVLGDNGRGTPERERLKAGAGLIQTITLSKAFGAYGGAVLCARTLRSRMLERSRIFIGSTPIPLPLASSGLRSLEIVASGQCFCCDVFTTTRRSSGQVLRQHKHWTRRTHQVQSFDWILVPSAISKAAQELRRPKHSTAGEFSYLGNLRHCASWFPGQHGHRAEEGHSVTLRLSYLEFPVCRQVPTGFQRLLLEKLVPLPASINLDPNHPAGIRPSNIFVASGSSRCSWIARFRGRAPNCGSNPSGLRKDLAGLDTSRLNCCCSSRFIQPFRAG